MKFQAHRGVGTEFPENTMPAFVAAVAQGYDYIELDPAFTKDDQCVILHDESLNRTCREKDGSVIGSRIKIADLSYEQALQYDAGIAKSPAFKGTKIPLLLQVLEFAKGAGLTVKLDHKIQCFSKRQTNILFNAVEKSGARVGFTCSNTEYIKKVLARFPNAQIHYDGAVDEPTLAELKSILKQNELYIWLPVPSPATAWANLPKPNKNLCATVKKYGKLGLWLLSNAGELEMAKKFEADIIETPGELKPEAGGYNIFDCHTHTHFSHDSNCDPRDSLAAAKQNGLKGITITDHCDIEFCQTQDVKTPILQSVVRAHQMGGAVLAGVEIGEAVWHKTVAVQVAQSADFDVILGSVHSVRYKSYTAPYSTVDFSAFSQRELNEYLSAYFNDLLELVNTFYFNVLSHLTCPLRYITGKYNISVDLSPFQSKIEQILKAIIQKGIALEVNTSCLNTNYNALMPNVKILKRYKELGGFLLTLGSDAHQAERVGYGFRYALNELATLGFKNIYYYQNQKPVKQEIK